MRGEISSGLVMWHMAGNQPEFFLVHPGGPFWKHKNEGAWTIPKGLQTHDEDLLTTAIREFEEETGIAPVGPFHPLGSIELKSKKIVHAWAFHGVWTTQMGLKSNTFLLEWPPRSGKFVETPEIDRAEWMPYEKACRMINQAQIPLLKRALDVIP